MGAGARCVEIEVEGGAIPTWVVGRDEPGLLPALVVVPSIFGPTPDLIALLAPLSQRALVALPDPFWRKDGGALPYVERERAVERMQGFDPRRCTDDLAAVLDWARVHSNGRVVLLGICFGGPFVLRFAAQGRLAAGVTWHGTRMENFLDRADAIRCPLRLHFGAADPVTPPEVIEKLRAAFAAHPEVSIVVHPGAVHGYSRDDQAHDARACRAGLEATRELLASLT